MRTVGVDLSAEDRGTYVATIDWDDAGGARLLPIRAGASNDVILDALLGADRVGIDCPLGWPVPFVEFVRQHESDHVWGAVDKRRRGDLSRRATDVYVAKRVQGCVPLSVSADRIAAVAMRVAGLLATLAAAGAPVDRTGARLIMEVYPAAALKVWELEPLPYKKTRNAGNLAPLVGRLQEQLRALDWGNEDARCRTSDDAFDSVVCALVARAAHLGLTDGPPDQLSELAGMEGWIHVPAPGSLPSLAG